MKIIDFIKSTIIGLYHSIQRFPIPIALSTSIVTLLIVISEIQVRSGYNDPSIQTLKRIAMVLGIGFLLYLCIKLIFEKWSDLSTIVHGIFYIAAAILLLVYYFFALKNFNMISISRYTAVIITLLLCFLFIPYIRKKEYFELYVIKIFSRFLITIIYSVVLFLGLAAIIFTLNTLLNVPIRERIYYYTWLGTAGVFAPIFFLAGVPTQDEHLESYGYPRLFKMLLLYIIMPLISVYLTILYIYCGKIIITQVWPIGLVSHLVLWYSVICIGVLFLISPIKNNAWVNKFAFFFPKLIIPILIMMFISMGIRIHAYGITENRYYVMVLSIWVLCIMLYFNLKKERKNTVIPISLAIITIASVFGPFSSFSISKWSQNSRFVNILIKNSMLQDHQLIPNSNISAEDKNEISRILSYFKNNHYLKDVKYLSDNFDLRNMTDVFGFPYEEYNAYDAYEQYYAYHADMNAAPLDIAGYDYLLDFRMGKNSLTSNNLKANYDYERGTIELSIDNETIYSFDIAQFSSILHEKYPSIDSKAIPQEDMIYTDQNDKVQVKFIFNFISGTFNPTKDDFVAQSSEFYLLLKVK